MAIGRLHEGVGNEFGALLYGLARGGDDGNDATLAELATAALSAVPEADHAGISFCRSGGVIETIAATDQIAAVLDQLQNGHGEGPTLSALRKRVTVRVDDVTGDCDWPEFSRLVVEHTPVRSTLILPMLCARKAGGALALHADRPGAFDGDSAVGRARIYAAYAALSWQQLRRTEQFKHALESRDEIGQAKGIIMERFSVDAAQAFHLLKKLSQNTNVPVAQLAREIIARVADPSSAKLR